MERREVVMPKLWVGVPGQACQVRDAAGGMLADANGSVPLSPGR